MSYKDDDGRLNNFAREPKIYQTQPLSQQEQRNYLVMAVITLLLVGGLIMVAIYASGSSVS